MKNEKTIRTLRVLFILSFLLDITVVGLLVGIPMFLVLWGLQYIFTGKSHPFYIFNTNKRLSKLFKNPETIRARVEKIYKIQFGPMEINYDSISEFLIKRMAEYYSYFVFELERLIDKHNLKFDSDKIIPVFQLIDCEVVILASADLITEEMKYLEKESLAGFLPNKGLLAFFVDNKDNISLALVDDRLSDVAKMLSLVEPCVKKYHKEVDELREALMNLDVKDFTASYEQKIHAEQNYSDYEDEIFDSLIGKDEQDKPMTEEEAIQALAEWTENNNDNNSERTK